MLGRPQPAQGVCCRPGRAAPLVGKCLTGKTRGKRVGCFVHRQKQTLNIEYEYRICVLCTLSRPSGAAFGDAQASETLYLRVSMHCNCTTLSWP